MQEPRSSVGQLVAGFLTTPRAACVAGRAFLVVSDRDDGKITLEVPPVRVDVETDTGN